MKSNIALIGFMGTGKTETGKLLAERLGKRFIELDELIARNAGKSISRIFDEDGEPRFRELESEAVKEVSRLDGVIISCGGGIVTNHANVESLKRNAVLVLLKASPKVILERTSADKTERPLLKTDDRLGRIRELLKSREALYESAADMVIDTDKMRPAEAAERIIREVGS
jgi:shikimate kinase